MKLTKGKLIAAFVIVCVLAGAFFLGGPSGAGENELPAQSAAEAAETLRDKEDPPTDTAAETERQEPAVLQHEIAAAEEPAQEENAEAEAAEAIQKPEAVPEVPPEASPEATPDPEEALPAETQDNQTAEQHRCTLSVSCATILDNLEQFNADKLEILPEDGVIFPVTEVSFSPGESAFDVLKREMIAAKIHFEFMDVPVYGASYIEGIANIYEFDCGQLSGWMYRVDGKFENYGSSLRLLEDGDLVEFVYTCDLGRDIGGFVEGG